MSQTSSLSLRIAHLRGVGQYSPLGTTNDTTIVPPLRWAVAHYQRILRTVSDRGVNIVRMSHVVCVVASLLPRTIGHAFGQ